MRSVAGGAPGRLGDAFKLRCPDSDERRLFLLRVTIIAGDFSKIISGARDGFWALWGEVSNSGRGSEQEGRLGRKARVRVGHALLRGQGLGIFALAAGT